MRDWAILGAFDMFSSAYDNPQRIGTVAQMFRRNSAGVSFAGYESLGAFGKATVVRGIKC